MLTTQFLKRQSNYQIAVIPQTTVNKPITASCPNERWGIDNVEQPRYKEFGQNKKSFLTIVDYYSRKCWAVPLRKNYDANDNYEALMSICIREHTYPHLIQCDNGGNFQGEFKRQIEEHNAQHPNQSIKIIYTSAYTPTANGLVERMNREFRKKIRAGFLLHNDLLWSQYMDEYANNINNQRNSTTGYTPAQLWTSGYNPVVYQNGQQFNPPVIDDHSTADEISHSLQTRLYLQSIKQFKTAKKRFRVGDIVRIKLSSFKQEPQVYAPAKIREKGKVFKKYDVINYSLARFRIDRAFPVRTSPQKYEQLINHYSDDEINKMLRCRYLLSREDFATGIFHPYLIENNQHEQFSPYFYDSDLIKVPDNSTGFNLNPVTTARVVQFNKYNYHRAPEALGHD